MCSAAGGQLWDPYTGVYNASQGGPVCTGFIPYNNMATYQNPENPNLTGTGYQLPPGQGNLMDPIAAKYIGNFATSGKKNFTPPDANDWVLAIDDSAANLPAPASP
ncbi:MAG: hypothetical protein WBE41_25995 [Terracidiphilus sp.]